MQYFIVFHLYDLHSVFSWRSCNDVLSSIVKTAAHDESKVVFHRLRVPFDVVKPLQLFHVPYFETVIYSIAPCEQQAIFNIECVSSWKIRTWNMAYWSVCSYIENAHNFIPASWINQIWILRVELYRINPIEMSRFFFMRVLEVWNYFVRRSIHVINSKNIVNSAGRHSLLIMLHCQTVCSSWLRFIDLE